MTKSSTIKLIVILIIASTTIFTSCEKEKILTVTPTSQVISKDAGVFTISVASNTDWTASSNADWWVLDKTSGSNKATITVNYEANPELSERTATITFSGKDVDNINIIISQDSKSKEDIEKEVGLGIQPQVGDKVTVHYTGTFIDGEQFDSSIGNTPFQFTLGIGQVINGFDEGISYMKKGGKAKLIIPSSIVYGADGYNSIPEYSTLIFDVELINIEINKLQL